MFIVTYDDNDCLNIPMTFDEDCEGAVCCSCDGDPIALFPSRSAARKAIAISTAYAKLCKEQGKTVNEDFLAGYRKNIKVRQCREQ